MSRTRIYGLALGSVVASCLGLLATILVKVLYERASIAFLGAALFNPWVQIGCVLAVAVCGGLTVYRFRRPGPAGRGHTAVSPSLGSAATGHRTCSASPQVSGALSR